MEDLRTASDVEEELSRIREEFQEEVSEVLLETRRWLVSCDGPAEQRSVLTAIAPFAHETNLQAVNLDLTLLPRNSRMYRELWEVTAPIYNSNSRKSHLYQALGKYEIRLISLIEHDGQKLVCRLDTYPHWLAPEYDALSYVWGDPTDTTVIICNGIELSIGTPLHVALRHFLDGAAQPLRPLWVDAICLDQQDDDEKAHQIPSMGNIYKLATRTLIWLGEAGDGSDKAMDFLRGLDQKTKMGEATKKEEAMLTSLQASQIGRRVIKSILALLRRSWFSRL